MLPIDNQELVYRIALTFIKDIGPKRAKALLSHFDRIEDIFKAPVKNLKHVEGLGEHIARSIKGEMDAALDRAQKELLFTEKNNIGVLWFQDDDYPHRLKNCADAPVLLFYTGNANLNAERMIAIVGTRKYTDYGQRLCDDLVEGLRELPDTVIVSGLAHGIDTIAHKNALKHQMPTIGALGHGLDIVYPATNRQLAREMTAHGGLLTEFPSGSLPDKSNFPMRNRIVAGISDITVVVESDIKGGALITARIASSYNREVAVFPGRVYDSKSSGCNELIRTNIASLITSAGDLAELMGWQGKKIRPVQKQLFLDFTTEEQTIVNILQSQDLVHADELLHKSGMPNSQLAATLLHLEMQDIIKALPGKYYRMN